MRLNFYMEKRVVLLPPKLAKFYGTQSVLLGAKFVPNWDVNEEESLLADDPELGGMLGYRLSRGVQLPGDRPKSDQLLAHAAQSLYKLQEIFSFLVQQSLSLHVVFVLLC